MLNVILMRLAVAFVFGFAMIALPSDTAAFEPVASPPGTYHTSWIGNSFGGNGAPPGHPNGFGYWVQDNISAMAVSADGTVFLGTIWDEAGRTVGLYKNGQPNSVLVRADTSPLKTWGFNTANSGVCVNGSNFYVATTVNKSLATALLRFSWTPGDPNSTKFQDETGLPQTAVSLSCDAHRIVVSYPDEIEVHDANTLQFINSVPVPGLSFALPSTEGGFWVISGKTVQHLDGKGNKTGAMLPGIGNPTALAWAPDGQLIVTDNGPAQQVLFFDVSGQPRLVSTFGVPGGLYSGKPGAISPLKLFALKGAGVDAQGNLYVGMSFSGVPSGNTFIRAFAPSGKLLWQNYATSFVDVFGFEPGSGGTIVFGRTTRWQLNLASQTPGTEASLEAVTLDPLKYPDDPRSTLGMSVYPRLIQGKQLLYALTQRGFGYRIFAGSPGSDILHQVARTPQLGHGWFVTDDGDIWNGDSPGRQIALYPLSSVGPDGVPVYHWDQPVTWPWPADYGSVSRVIYDKDKDSLYVFGYLDHQRLEAAGVLGYAARRYDGWRSGQPTVKWNNTALPISPDGLGLGKQLSPKDAALAGHYLFLVMVRSPKQQVRVHILDADNGKLVGTLVAGPEVGAVGGDQDIFGSVRATQTASGEYLVLVEDDWRAKNILFRWKP